MRKNYCVRYITCDLNSVDWNEVYEAHEVDSAYNSFLSIFSSHCNNHFPLLTKTTGKFHKNQPWITQSIVNSCLFKNRFHRRYLRNPTAANERFKTYLNRLTATISSAKKRYDYADKLDYHNGNLKSMWREINGILGKPKESTLPASFTIDGDHFVSQSNDIPDSFNKFLTSIASSLAKK